MTLPYKKVLIVGCGGSGKSTLAREMGKRFGLPVVHLDRIWWRAGWVHVTREEFDQALAVELKKSAWIIDGDYSRTFAMRLEHADFCILLDLDTKTCLESAYERARKYRGKTRPDMTEGCEERVDAEFEQWILRFKQDVLPKMLEILKESGVAHRVFTTREEAYAWMNGFERAEAQEDGDALPGDTDALRANILDGKNPGRDSL